MTLAESLALFLGPEDVVEIRAFDVQKPGRVVAGFVRADKLRERESAVVQIADRAAGGCYFTPQRLDPTVLNRTKNLLPEVKRRNGQTQPKLTEDADVIARRYLLVDIDPVRADGFEKHSATDDEKAAAWAVAAAARVYLTTRGWADPLVVDSGNGYHLYYRLPGPLPGGPVADPARDPLGLTLRALAKWFNSTAARIDPVVFNASRIMKVPGTVARKGTHTTERPHRTSYVVSVPLGWNVA